MNCSNVVIKKYIDGPSVLRVVQSVAIGMSLILVTISSTEINRIGDIFQIHRFSKFHQAGQITVFEDRSVGGRICPRCGHYKNLLEFYKNKSKPDGHESHCKICVLAKKARPKLITGGPIELKLNLKASKNFDEGLSCVLDIICKEIVGDA